MHPATEYEFARAWRNRKKKTRAKVALGSLVTGQIRNARAVGTNETEAKQMDVCWWGVGGNEKRERKQSDRVADSVSIIIATKRNDQFPG